LNQGVSGSSVNTLDITGTNVYLLGY